MGRGDKKTKRGKIFKGSFGKTRPANKTKKETAPASTDVPAVAPTQAPAKKS